MRRFSYARQSIALVLIAFPLLVSSPSIAEPNPSDWQWKTAGETERQAYSCAALMFILTSSTAPEFQKFAKEATSAGMMLDPIAAAKSIARLGEPVNRGYVTKVRDREVHLLAARWKTDPVGIVNLANKCDGWVAKIAEDVHDGLLTGPAQVEFRPPYSSKKDNLPEWVEAAFEAFLKMGAMTPSDVTENLRRELAK